MNWDWEKLQEKRRQQPGGFGGSGGGGSGNNNNGGAQPPGFDQLGKNLQKFRNAGFPAGKLLILAVFLVWAASGIFIVEPDEVGVVLRFGAFNRKVDAGPHYRFPYPFESVSTPKVTQVKRVELGFSSGDTRSRQGQVRQVLSEASMLTGDENIVNVQFIVQYRIKNAESGPDASGPVDYLFNIVDPDGTVKSAAEAAMREIIGASKIDSALTDGKLQIQTAAAKRLQEIMDRYQSGISIQGVQMGDVHPPDEVVEFFKDVASAREDKSRSINEAEAYQNEIIPKARGAAAEIINQAEAYKAATVQNAQGSAQRFAAILAEYQKAPDVTKKRMYLETMEEVLASKDLEKIIMPEGPSGRVVPYLPLDRLPAEQSVPKGGK